MTHEDWYASGHILKLARQQVFVRREGAGNPLFCLHGFPTSSWDFEAIWTELSAQFDVFASDLIGLGRSAKPKAPISVKDQADVIEALALHFKIEQAHLLAHDLGDTVAQELLARQQEGRAKLQWQSCVFLNGGLFPETHRPRFIQTLLASPLGPLVATLSSKRTFRKNMVRIFSSKYPPSDDFINSSWELLIENNGRQMLPRLIRYMNERRIERTRWVKALTDSKIPLRFINGVQDPVSGRHAAQRYRELLPNADVVLLEDAGHYPHVEQPQAVLNAFYEFHERHFNQPKGKPPTYL
ncbi:MAG: alpha/beta hydrolase [Planctomycetota bacterium]|nr:alpha/beta hydrolase [Planctomycetota bacterium]